jgi:glycosyltransferase involved in cell wall biosynthesis
MPPSEHSRSAAHAHGVAHVLRKYDIREWGGTETHVAAVTAGLCAHGWHSTVYAPAGPHGRGRLAEDVDLVRYRAFLPFIGSREQRRGLIANSGNLASFDLLWRLWRDPHIQLVHLHTRLRIGGAARTAMRMSRRPYVLSLHGPVFADAEWMQAETAKRYSGLIDLGKPIGLLLGSRHVLEDAARVICFNDAEHKELTARIGDRAVRFDHGVDIARFAAGQPERILERWPALRGRRVIALVGRICRQKNQLLAVRAFAQGAPKDALLVLAGGQTDVGYADQVMGEARTLGIGDRVTWLGNLAPEEVPHMLATAELVLVPSTQEAFGMAVAEAWAAGRPVLFSRRSGLADIAASLANPEPALESLQVEDWAHAIAAMCADESRRQAARDDGARVVIERFDWARHVARLDQLYRDVLAEQRP